MLNIDSWAAKLHNGVRKETAMRIFIGPIVGVGIAILISAFWSNQNQVDQWHGENGQRRVMSIYPAGNRLGTWATFLAEDGSRRETFVYCPARVAVGDLVTVTGAEPRGRGMVYYARCNKTLPE